MYTFLIDVDLQYYNATHPIGKMIRTYASRHGCFSVNFVLFSGQIAKKGLVVFQEICQV